LLDFCVMGKEMKVCNIHAPNDEREKITFYKDMNELIGKNENIMVILIIYYRELMYMIQ